MLTSPYSRALQTAEIIADTLGLPLEVEPLVRERCAFACDVGLPRSELARRWPHVGFDHLPERWWPEDEESEEALSDRCRTFASQAIARDGWDRLVVVTHWGVIRSLTGLQLGNCEHVRFDPATV